MYTGKIIFAQIMDFLPHYDFHQCVQRYGGHYKMKSFSCSDQFRAMAFAQLTHRESLRDIETCLRAMKNKLYHMGIRSKISRSTLADANESRTWRIYADFAQILISIARPLYRDEDFGVDLQNTVYALDATLIELCFSLFPWAGRINQRPGVSAIKLQTLLDLRGNIPTFLHLDTPGGCDASVLDELVPEPGSFYIMDRGYLDTSRLYALHQASAFFLVRCKTNILSRRLYSHPVDKTAGLKCDQTILFSGQAGFRNYPEKLRRIRFRDPLELHELTLLTNQFTLPAFSITQLYKCRWQIELFFKWIKQHLRIQSFYGTSENAVLTQIWIAISVYVLIAIIKKKLGLSYNLYTFLQVLGVTLFEKMSIQQAVTAYDSADQNGHCSNQLSLFN